MALISMGFMRRNPNQLGLEEALPKCLPKINHEWYTRSSSTMSKTNSYGSRFGFLGRGQPSVDVFKTDDVVFADIFSHLYFN